MTEHSVSDMKNACHALAAQILTTPAYTNRCKWLRTQVAEMLKNIEHVEYYAKAYEEEYPYADVRNVYLADVLKSYDQQEDL